MQRTLTLKYGEKGEIEFCDLDDENEIEVRISNGINESQSIYLGKQNLISLAEHIKYLLYKMD